MIWPSFLLRFEKVADLLTLPGLLGHAPRKSRVDDRVARAGGINSKQSTKVLLNILELTLLNYQSQGDVPKPITSSFSAENNSK